MVVFNLLPSRARYVIHSLLGETPQGVVISDRYAAYAHIPAEQRQLCWAHQPALRLARAHWSQAARRGLRAVSLAQGW